MRNVGVVDHLAFGQITFCQDLDLDWKILQIEICDPSLVSDEKQGAYSIHLHENSRVLRFPDDEIRDALHEEVKLRLIRRDLSTHEFPRSFSLLHVASGDSIDTEVLQSNSLSNVAHDLRCGD